MNKLANPRFLFLIPCIWPGGLLQAELYLNLSNNEIPKANGESLDEAPGMFFDSPFIRSVYQSGSLHRKT